MSFLDESHRLDRGNAELYVEQVGPPDGQVVLYLHGGPGYNSASFRDLVGDDLTDLRLLYADQRGAGRSYAADDFELQDLADDAVAILNDLDVHGVTLLAHGFGALVAVRAATSAPERIGRLVLVNPWLSMPLLARDLRDAALALGNEGGGVGSRPRIADATEAGSDPTTTDEDPAALANEAFSLVNPKVLLDAMEFPQAASRLRLEHADATALLGPSEPQELRDMWYLDALDEVASLRQATVILVGTLDATVYPNQAEATLQRMPGALVSLLAVGHYPWIDDPETFLSLLRQALVATVGQGAD